MALYKLIFNFNFNIATAASSYCKTFKQDSLSAQRTNQMKQYGDMETIDKLHTDSDIDNNYFTIIIQVNLC